MGAESIVPMIDRVVASPKDTPIDGGARVVELPAGIANTLTTIPSDGFALGRSKRLRHQYIVIDGDNIIRKPLQQRRKSICSKCNAFCENTSMWCAGDDVISVFLDLCNGRMLENLNTQRKTGSSQSPGEMRRVHQGRSTRTVQCPDEEG